MVDRHGQSLQAGPRPPPVKWLLAILLLATSLAGCEGGPEDFSRERMVVSISDQAGGYAVGIPLWLAPGGATAEEWLAASVVHSGAAELSLRETEAGLALWVEGNGSVTINANDLLSIDTGARPEAYLDGRHSLGTGPNGRALLWVETGDVDVTWQYEGTSRDCALFINHGWVAAQGGVHVADYGSRPDPGFDCVR